MNDIEIAFELNGEFKRARVAANLLLVDYLREAEQLKGTKIGCARGVWRLHGPDRWYSCRGLL